MNRQKFLDKIKLLFSEVDEENSKEKLTDIVTVDGVTLRISGTELVEGEKLLIVSVDEEGKESEADAPEGEYFVDGKVITADAEGLIVSIKEAEPEEEKEGEGEGEGEKIEEEMSVVPEWAQKLEARLTAIEEQNSNVSESMSAIDELKTLVSKIADLPADEEVKLSKAEKLKKSRLKTREEKLKFLSKR